MTDREEISLADYHRLIAAERATRSQKRAKAPRKSNGQAAALKALEPRTATQEPRDMSPERFDAQHPGWNCRWNDAGYTARLWATGRLVGPCATRKALSRELEAAAGVRNNGDETDG